MIFNEENDKSVDFDEDVTEGDVVRMKAILKRTESSVSDLKKERSLSSVGTISSIATPTASQRLKQKNDDHLQRCIYIYLLYIFINIVSKIMDTESMNGSSPRSPLVPARLKTPLPRSSLSLPPQTQNSPSPVSNEIPNILPITVSNASNNKT